MNKRTLHRMFSVLMALVMAVSLLTGCGTKSAEQVQEQEDAQTIQVYLWTTSLYENYAPYIQAETTAKFGIYNESTLSKWERIYYEEGESGLYRDNRGKMRTKPNKQELQPQEENDLRVENQRLRAEVAYLKKLRVLVEERIVRENGNGQKPSKN